MHVAAVPAESAAHAHCASSATFRLASPRNLYPFIDISMPAMLSVSRVQSAMLEGQTISGVWTVDRFTRGISSAPRVFEPIWITVDTG